MYIKVSKVLHRALLQKQHSHQVRGSQTYRRVGLSLMPHRHYTRVRAYAYNDDWWPAILSTPGHPRPSLLLLIGQQQQFFVLLYHCRWRQSSQVKHVETFNTVVTAVEMTYATCLFNTRSDNTLSRASCQEFSCSAMVVNLLILFETDQDRDVPKPMSRPTFRKHNLLARGDTANYITCLLHFTNTTSDKILSLIGTLCDWQRCLFIASRAQDHSRRPRHITRPQRAKTKTLKEWSCVSSRPISLVIIENTIQNKLCAWRHNMPPPAASWQYIRIYSPGGSCSGMLAIKDISNKLTLDLWPWKWCPSHMWRGLSLCQF